MWTAHHDYNSSVTVNGEHSYVGCNVSGNSVDCDDAVGGFTVHFANGDTMVLDDTAWIIGGDSPAREFGMWQVGSPLATHLIGTGKQTETFQYRLATYKLVETKEVYMCVPAMAQDKHNKPVPGEACYSMSFVTPSAEVEANKAWVKKTCSGTLTAEDARSCKQLEAME